MIRFVVVESFLIGCLVILAGYSFLETAGRPLDLSARDADAMCCQGLLRWEPEFIIPGVVIICSAPIAAYWMLQKLRMTRSAFWSLTVLTIAFQTPAIFSHNSIDWLPNKSIPWLATGLSVPTVATLLLSSLTLLVTLHRVADLRRMYANFVGLSIDYEERRAVLVREITVLGGLVGVSLAVAAALLAGGLALAELDIVLGRSPWTVLTIGSAALCLLGYFLYLWLRRNRSV